ncbi:hypothetical protein GOBAR_DD29191 [Gossypium barbadense]|nr:hypothetical protein GOBAR_DD29191 [Gossypium barbadense]
MFEATLRPDTIAMALPSTEANCNKLLQLPRIPSLLKFARRDQYAEMEERKWPAGVLDNLSQRSNSNEIASHLELRDHSEKVWPWTAVYSPKHGLILLVVGGLRDYHAIKRWQSQAAAADPDFFHRTVHVKDEEESNTSSRQLTRKHDERANENSISQVAVSKERFKNDPRGADHIKHAVVVYVGSLLMPLYKARKIDKDGNKSIMKKTATKVMEMTSRSFINWSKGQTSKGELTILLALTKHTVIFYMEIPQY